MESIDEEDNIGRIPTSSSSQKLLGTGNKEDQSNYLKQTHLVGFL